MSKEHAYAYEAGYRDGSINYELEHCPACKNVADLQEALAENARLRELIADTLLDPREYCEKYGIEYEGWDSANAHIDKRMIELGVDVRK